MSPGRILVESTQSAFWQTNTGIITDPDGGVVLIDPGVFPDELAALASRIGEGELIAALATHEDWDHVLWSAELGRDVPRLAHPDVVRVLDGERPALLSSLATAEHEFGVSWDHDLVGRLEPIATEAITIGDHIRITVIPTPGHTPVHTSLLLEEEGILFAGDVLSDVDVPMLANVPDAAHNYLTTLDSLADIVERVTTIIPGHGSPCDTAVARQRLERDRRYLELLLDGTGEPTPPIDPRWESETNRDAHRSNLETVLHRG